MVTEERIKRVTEDIKNFSNYNAFGLEDKEIALIISTALRLREMEIERIKNMTKKESPAYPLLAKGYKTKSLKKILELVWCERCDCWLNDLPTKIEKSTEGQVKKEVAGRLDGLLFNAFNRIAPSEVGIKSFIGEITCLK